VGSGKKSANLHWFLSVEGLRKEEDVRCQSLLEASQRSGYGGKLSLGSAGGVEKISSLQGETLEIS